MSTCQVQSPSPRRIVCTTCGGICLVSARVPYPAQRRRTPLCPRCTHLDLAELQPLLQLRSDHLLERAILLERQAAQLLAQAVLCDV